MPVEQSDNTRVVRPSIIPMDQRVVVQRANKTVPQQLPPQNQAQLWDADKIKKYENMQNFYNNIFWGYGVFGRQTNYNPRTPQGQAAIQANFDYAKSNVQNFAETLATTGIAEGAGQAVRWATTPTKIGSGAEAIVSSAPASTRVTKVTTIPRSEMHVRNSIPGALKSEYVGSSNGLHTYTQKKVRILSREQVAKAFGQLEKLMKSKGWKRVTHPNLQGLGFTNGRHVVSDLGPGNIGRDWLGRLRLTDFSVETIPQFRAAMMRKGGTLNS